MPMYVRFRPSLRDMEELLFERVIHICHQTVWWSQFGPLFSSELRRTRCSRLRGFRYGRWHLRTMYVKPKGEMVYL